MQGYLHSKIEKQRAAWKEGSSVQCSFSVSLDPLSIEFSRQEYWSGLPCPPPVDLPDKGIEPGSPALQADYLPTVPLGKPLGGVETHLTTDMYKSEEGKRAKQEREGCSVK